MVRIFNFKIDHLGLDGPRDVNASKTVLSSSPEQPQHAHARTFMKLLSSKTRNLHSIIIIIIAVWWWRTEPPLLELSMVLPKISQGPSTRAFTLLKASTSAFPIRNVFLFKTQCRSSGLFKHCEIPQNPLDSSIQNIQEPPVPSTTFNLHFVYKYANAELLTFRPHHQTRIFYSM